LTPSLNAEERKQGKKRGGEGKREGGRLSTSIQLYLGGGKLGEGLKEKGGRKMTFLLYGIFNKREKILYLVKPGEEVGGKRVRETIFYSVYGKLLILTSYGRKQDLGEVWKEKKSNGESPQFPIPSIKGSSTSPVRTSQGKKGGKGDVIQQLFGYRGEKKGCLIILSRGWEKPGQERGGQLRLRIVQMSKKKRKTIYKYFR